MKRHAAKIATDTLILVATIIGSGFIAMRHIVDHTQGH